MYNNIQPCLEFFLSLLHEVLGQSLLHINRLLYFRLQNRKDKYHKPLQGSVTRETSSSHWCLEYRPWIQVSLSRLKPVLATTNGQSEFHSFAACTFGSCAEVGKNNRSILRSPSNDLPRLWLNTAFVWSNGVETLLPRKCFHMKQQSINKVNSIKL